MTIYVDDYRAKFRGMIMCHLMSDESIEELHEFASRLKLKRSWFQQGSAPHYDVCLSKKKQAVEMGAKEVSIHEDSKEWCRVYNAARGLYAKIIEEETG